jgi:SAM-dependent methyltransferase
MTPTALARSYDEIAHVWQEPHIQTNGIPQFERAISFTKQRHHALDIGCGSSGRFLDLLFAHGFHAEGLDVSERMIALARQNRPAITFHHADISTWELPRSYDFISAWDSIWHLPLAAQEPVLRKICDGLAPGGVFIFTTGGLDGPEEKSDTSMGAAGALQRAGNSADARTAEPLWLCLPASRIRPASGAAYLHHRAENLSVRWRCREIDPISNASPHDRRDDETVR